ncbi:MAG TPA: hypothetical protein VH539_21640 [Gemmatimonadaceae bacterium]|jgi:hypothetical protein
MRRLAAFLVAITPALLRAQTHQLVDIGGYRPDVLRAGSGAPTVVFEAGLAGSRASTV